MKQIKERKCAWLRYIILFALFLVHGSIVGARDFVSPPSLKPYVNDSLLEHLFEAASVWENEVAEYQADLYLKGRFRVHKSNRIVKYIPSMFRLEKGVNDYIHESISELHYTSPRIYDRKVRAVQTTIPGGNSRFFDVLNFLKFNIYSPSVMGDKILSPMSRENSIHYHYLLDSIDYSQKGEEYKIHVIPRFRSTQLMEGYLWVSSDDWTIRYLDLEGKYDLITFHIVMQMGVDDKSKYLPQLLNLDVVFKFMKNHFEMNYTGWLNYKDVAFHEEGDTLRVKQKNEDYNMSSSYTLTADTTRLIEDRAAFARIRPLPLSDEEEWLYREFDARKMHRADTLVDMSRRKKNLVMMGQFGDALISCYDIDMSKIGNVTCSPLINPLLVSYSHRNGISYKQEFKYNKLFHNDKLLHIVPQVGYNFTQKELYAKLDAEYVYAPKHHGSFTVNVGNGNRIYSSVVLDQLKQMPDSTFNFDDIDLEYFKDVYVILAHNYELFNGFSLMTGLSMHWRYTAYRNSEVEGRVRTRYNGFAPRIRVSWTPKMHYYMNGNRKVNIGSRCPTFVVDYEHGLNVLNNSGSYQRLEMSAEQVINIRKIHSLAYHVGGGFFTKQKEMYFVDFVDFANRNLPQGWNDDIGGTFQMLDGRWYNSSRHYIRGNMTYETPFLLLYPVSKLLSFIQKERVYGGVLFMPHLNPYLEFGYGIGTHLFDFGVFVGHGRGKFTSLGFKFTFELFNK